MKMRKAFTLVEVLISLAIALILILGISQIFGLAQRTTGAGNAVLAFAEADRGMMPIFTRDFRTMVDGSSMPALVISSYALGAFRNRADMVQDLDGDPCTVNNVSGSGSTGAMSYTQINERMHRLDKLGFFSRSTFSRQTSDNGSTNLTSPTTSDEAFVWYGHLALPNNPMIQNWKYATPDAVTGANSAWYNPGQPNVSAANVNDNNLFSSNWMLGRQVMLMLPRPPLGSSYFPGPPTAIPFDLGSNISVGAQELNSRTPQRASRFDLVATSIDRYRQFLFTVCYPGGFSATVPPRAWGWARMMGITFPIPSPPPTGTTDPRFKANPFPYRPDATAANGVASAQWMAAAIAQTSPILARGCSQFIVEYAGNFVTQDLNNAVGNASYGQILSAKPDPTGKLDFTVAMDPSTRQWTQHVRWYGFPRDPYNEGTIGVQGAKGSVQFGVCPLRDTLVQATDFAAVYPSPAYPNTPSLAPPERAAPPLRADYLPALGSGGPPPMPAVNGTASSYYICAWGPDTINFPQPKLIRITFALDDPDGHLNSSQTFEYVFALP